MTQLPTPILHRSTKSILLPKSCDYLISELQNARMVTVGDKSVVQIKHDEMNTKKLNEIGFCVQSPFNTYYKPPKIKSRFDPMPHQLVAAEFHTMNPRSFNLSDPRTGKTYSLLLSFHHLKLSGQVDKMIIFSTLSTMDSVWMQSIFDTFHDLTSVSVHASSAATRREILASDVDILVINHDGCKLLEPELIKMTEKYACFIAHDESDCLTNAQSAMWKSFYNVAKKAKYVVCATATPVGEKRPTDAWALAKIICPDNIPRWFSEYRRQTMFQQTQFKWSPLPNANAIVHKTLQPAFCVRKTDVMVLPKLHSDYKLCDLTEEQRVAFKDMKNKLAAEMGDGKLTAINGADALTKSMQLLLGVYKADEDNYEPIPCEPRIDAILECINATNKKAIVFCGFTGALRHYTKEIGKHHSVVMVDGSVGKKERDKLLKSFASKDGPRVLAGHPKCLGHGLEFGENCDTIIWAGPIHSGRLFTQANERIASLLQTSEMKLWYIYANKFEESLYKKLEEKRDMQSDILELCKTVIGS